MRPSLWARIKQTETCWLWTGPLDTFGYGKVKHHGVGRGAHRVIYELLVGPVRDGLELDHRCRVKRCVNPAHLEPVTHRENMRRRYALYTHCRRGHPYIEANTYMRPDGSRDCCACIRARVAAYKRRKRGAA